MFRFGKRWTKIGNVCKVEGCNSRSDISIEKRGTVLDHFEQPNVMYAANSAV